MLVYRKDITGFLLQVSINGPEPGTRKALEVINKAKEKWIAAKARCKLPKKVVPVLVSDRGVIFFEVGQINEELDSVEVEEQGKEETTLEQISVECEEQAPVEKAQLELNQLRLRVHLDFQRTWMFTQMTVA